MRPRKWSRWTTKAEGREHDGGGGRGADPGAARHARAGFADQLGDDDLVERGLGEGAAEGVGGAHPLKEFGLLAGIEVPVEVAVEEVEIVHGAPARRRSAHARSVSRTRWRMELTAARDWPVRRAISPGERPSS